MSALTIVFFVSCLFIFCTAVVCGFVTRVRCRQTRLIEALRWATASYCARVVVTVMMLSVAFASRLWPPFVIALLFLLLTIREYWLVNQLERATRPVAKPEPKSNA